MTRSTGDDRYEHVKLTLCCGYFARQPVPKRSGDVLYAQKQMSYHKRAQMCIFSDIQILFARRLANVSTMRNIPQ